MKTSVLLTVYNRPEYLRLCLRALELQTVPPDEIVVADDGSDADAVARMNPFLHAGKIPVKYVRQEHDGYRLAAARNLAICAATGDYLVFIDCDILLLPDTLAMHRARQAPRLLLISNRALLDEAATQTLFAGEVSAGSLEKAWAGADRTHFDEVCRLFARHALLRKFHFVRAHKPKLLGCHFSLFRADVERINGFDENYVGWGYEDDDFARRLQWSGVRPECIVRDARAMHLWHPTLKPAHPRRRDRPNRPYFRRWNVPIVCGNGLRKNGKRKV